MRQALKRQEKPDEVRTTLTGLPPAYGMNSDEG